MKIRIAIIGQEGVGKTTIIQEIKKQWPSINIITREKNDIPNSYYKNLKNTYLDSQKLYFESWKKQIRALNNNEGISIIDRHIIEDITYFNVIKNMSILSKSQKEEGKNIKNQIIDFVDSNPKIDFIFLIGTKLKTITKRIIKRAQNNKSKEFQLYTCKNWWKNIYKSFYIKNKTLLNKLNKYSVNLHTLLNNKNSKKSAKKIIKIIKREY